MQLGGALAEELVFGVASTGAHDDLITATELARKMVREWGMSERLGHLAWGSQAQVFLGEDLIHTRDYSDETARLIDEETEHILSAQASVARNTLKAHRHTLDAVAAALLTHETLSGDEAVDSHRHSRTRRQHDRCMLDASRMIWPRCALGVSFRWRP